MTAGQLLRAVVLFTFGMIVVKFFDVLKAADAIPWD